MLKRLSLLLLVVFVGACASESATDNKKLRVAVPFEPVSMTPFGSNDTSSYRVRWQVFDRLVNTGQGGKILPMLAVSWEDLSATTIQLALRSNVMFHDGEEFTSEDVKYSVESAVASSDLFAVIGVIKDVDIVDRYTVNINFNVPYSQKALVLGHPGILMTKRSAMESDTLIGTGPYKFKEWNRGLSVILTQNEEYWGEGPFFEEVEFVVVPEASVRTIVAETGEVDIAYELDGSEKENLTNSSTLTYLEGVAPTIHYLGFNLTKPAYADKRFRQAVAMAIDYQGIVERVAFNVGAPATSLIHGGVLGAKSDLPARQRNLEEAKKILSEIDVPETINIYAIDGVRKKMAEIIQANLMEIGLNVQVVTLEYATMLDYAKKGNLDMFILGWTTIPPDADIGLNALLFSSNKFTGGNYSAYSNAQVDQLLIDGRKELNPQTRNQMYAQLQEIVYDELPLIPLYHPHNNAIINKNIKNFEVSYFGIHELQTVKY